MKIAIIHVELGLSILPSHSQVKQISRSPPLELQRLQDSLGLNPCHEADWIWLFCRDQMSSKAYDSY